MTYALAAWQFLKRLPWQAWAAAGLFLAAWLYGNARYDAGVAHEAAKRDRAIAEAVLKAIEVERAAQANHEGREAERQADTGELKQIIESAPVGEKTKAVLDALRNS